MAFSMYLRSTGRLSPMVKQQMSRLVTQPPALNRAVTTCLPASSLLDGNAKKNDSTPIMNAVRSFRTTPVLLQHDEEHPHDHATLWIVERATSALLVVLVPPFLMMPNKYLDCIIATLICAHSFWGLEAIVVDYVRASIFGPVIPKIAIGLVYAITFATLGGLFYITFHDVGLGNSIRSHWAIKSEQKA